MLKRAGRSLVVAAGVLLVAVSSASATTTTFVVNDTADAKLADSAGVACASTLGPTDCTLRAAIQAADNIGGNVEITLPAGTYTLSIAAASTGTPQDDPSTGDLDILATNGASTQPQVTIDGAGPGSTVINANGVDRAFTVHDYTSSVYPSLSLSGVTIKGGAPSAYSYNHTLGGGAIFNEGGMLTITDSVLTGNTAAGQGGAVYAAGSGLSITGSTIAGNTASTAGGGIAAVTTSVVQLTNDTLDGNTAPTGGGLAYPGAPPGPGSGLLNVTIAHNSGAYGGGVYNPVYAGSIENTIIAANDNTGGASGAADCYGGSLALNAPDEASTADAGGNLDSDGTCFSNSVSHDVTGVDPKLGTLADANGGPTPTDAIDADSPAVSLGLAADCPATDQRGFDRLSAHCDAGAYQGDEADLAVTASGPSDAKTGTSFTDTYTVTNNGPYGASSVTFSDQLPAGGDGSVSGAGTCTGTTTVSCQLGTLNSGQSVTLSVDLVVNQAGSAINTASVGGASLDTNAANNSASVSTGVGSPPTGPGGPFIIGYDPPVKGNTLTADPGTWAGSGLTFTYQWLTCGAGDDYAPECAPIGGATDAEYVVASSDVGNELAVEVTAANAFGSASAYSKVSGQVIDNILKVSSPSTNGSSVTLPLECAAEVNEINPACILLILLSGEAVNPNALAHGRARSKAIVYARKQVKIAAGKKVKVPVKLNHAGQVLLARRHVLRLKLTISENGHVLSTRTITFRYRKPKKRKAG